MTVDRGLDGALDLFGKPRVGGCRERSWAEARLRALEIGSVPAGDHHAGAVRHECLGNGEADAFRPAGDQCDLAFEDGVHGAGR